MLRLWRPRPHFLTHTCNGRAARFLSTVQANMFPGSVLHCKEIYRNSLPEQFIFVINSIIQQLVTSLMFNFTDHLDFKG